MGFFKWLYRLPGRLNKSMERTALASSVETSNPGPQSNTVGVQSGLGFMEENETAERGATDPESTELSPGG